MSVVGFVSEKGGVGKTTALYHIAVALQAYHEMRVLVVDADYQRGGITCRFLPQLLQDFRSGQMPHVTLWEKFQQLYSGQQLTTAVDVLPTVAGPQLMPADPRLSQVSVDKMPASNNIRENNRRLWEHLSLIRAVLEPRLEDFDYILIDTHPEISDVLRSVIYACDYCVSPVKLDLQSTIGVPSVIEAMNEVNADVQMIQQALANIPPRAPTRFVGAMGMMAREYGGGLKQSERAEYRRLTRSGGVFDNYVTEGDGLRQAAAQRVPVYNVAGANAQRQAQQFRDLTTEFVGRCPP